MKKVVFTNGCFDLIHPGHIQLLEQARALGTYLVVGINSDRSVRSIKGAGRPLVNENERAEVLRAMRAVDEVRVFDELTPAALIEEIKPDVLVKGGDWPISEIVGASFVQSYGGEVRSLPLKDGFSSTAIIESMKDQQSAHPEITNDAVAASLAEHQSVFEKLADGSRSQIEECADLLFDTFKNGKKVLIFGNGGSAADAQHLAAEFVGRYETERKGLPAIALTTDTSALTALANDYDFERVFARQVEALASPGDCVVAISTSGNSPNVIAAVMRARDIGCNVIGLTGEKGKKLAALSDVCVMVPSSRTARIQEGHIAIAHIWCELIDQWIKDDK